MRLLEYQAKELFKEFGIRTPPSISSKDIEKGEKFSNDNLQIMRAGEGLSPMAYWQVLGQSAKRSFRAGEPVSLG